MYLKSLSLKGFKSFADKSQLNFEPGMTVVVGPNGSGKSNISDAILWVLGEQSAKQLRGQAMEDVIFAGSSARKAVSVAEVDLVLDNSDHLIPLDFEELAITRRMYRSGESEYFINGSPSRLMDIQDILHDSGLGKDTHSIISQGKLDNILQSRPEERRKLIEEAAGIAKHKKRKERSLKKMERMDKHLQRAQDIQKELLKQLRPLEKQVDKAQRFQNIQQELQELETILAVDDLRQLKRSWGCLDHEFKEAAASLELARYRVAEKEKELTKFQRMLEEHGLFVGDLAEQRRRMQSVLERLHAQEKLLEQKGRTMVLRLSELRASLHKSQRQFEHDHAELKGLKLEYELSKSRDCALRTKLFELRSSAGKARQSRQELDLSLKGLNTRYTKLSAEHTAAELELAKLKDSMGNVELEDEIFSKRLAELREKLATDHGELSLAQKSLEGYQEKIKLQEQKLTYIQTEIQSGTSHVQDSQIKLKELEKELSLKRARKAALDEYCQAQYADNEYRHFFSRYSEQAHTPQFVELLSQLQIEPEYDSLFETLFHAELQALLVRTDFNESELQSWLKEKRTQGEQLIYLGNHLKTSFYMNKELQDLCEDKKLVALVTKLTASSEYNNLIQSLFAHYFLLTDDRDALSLSQRYPECVFVTTQGHCIMRGALLRLVAAPSQEGLRKGMLARKRELDKLARLLPELEARLTQATQELKQAEEALEQIKVDEHQLVRELAAFRGQEQSCVRELGRLEQTISKAQAESHQLEQQKTLLLHRAEQAKEKLSQVDSKLQRQNEELHSLTLEIRELESERDEARFHERELSGQLSQCQLESATLTERLKQLSNRIDTLELSVKKLGEACEISEDTALKLEKMGLRVEPLHRMCALLSEYALSWAQRLRDQASLEEAGSADLKKTISDAQGAIAGARLKEHEAQSLHYELSLKKASLDVQVEAAVQKIQAQKGVILEEALLLPEPEDREVLKKRRDKLAYNLEHLGPVNLVAMDEYQKLKERTDHISTQVEDLQESRRALSKIVSAIDRKMKDQFLRTYEQVNFNFQELFSTLFPGGKAYLEMSDPDRPAETGIEVVAQPKGKRLAKMMLLSGGEKSLTALALLFAVYKTRTVPFYVLDEVEAALDDSNLDRLLGAIEVLRQQTQLIVVSHQRKTMERADVLYGVSMQTDGVSRVISQKLERERT